MRNLVSTLLRAVSAIGGCRAFGTPVATPNQRIILLLGGVFLSATLHAQNWFYWDPAAGGNGHYYALTPARGSWSDAQAAANAWGGTLATITSSSEQAFINNTFLIGDFERKPLWIGLSDAVTEGTFTWITGEPLTFTYWKSGEPNNTGGNEDYVAINWDYARGTGFRGSWNDTPVNGSAGYGGNTDGPYHGLIERTEPLVCPTFTSHPSNRFACEGQSTTFVAEVQGSIPMVLQWLRDGSPIPGATSSAYTIASVTLADAGAYSVTASNGCGSITSAAGQLAVADLAPVVILNGEPTITLEACSGPYVEPGATALDACDGVLLLVVDGSSVNTSVPGTYTVSYSATDSGNQTTAVNRTVIVEDTTVPAFVDLPEPANLTLPCGSDNQATIEAWLDGVTATDACGTPHVTYQVAWQDACSASTAAVTWTARDQSGNAATLARTLTIETDYRLENTSFSGGNVSLAVARGRQQQVIIPLENTGLCPETIEFASFVAGFTQPAITVVSPAFPVTLCAGGTAAVAIQVDTTGAFDGTYRGTLSLSGPNGSSKSVEIEVVVTGQALPDLALNYFGGGLSVLPAVGSNSPRANEDFTIGARIKNLGTLGAGAFEVVFFEGNNRLGSENVPSLVQGQSITVLHAVRGGLAEGYHLVRAEIVPPIGGELRLNNNSASSFLQVGTPGSGSAILVVEASARQACEPDKGSVDVRAHYAIASGGKVFEYPVQGGSVEVDVLSDGGDLPGLRGGHTNREGRYQANLSLIPGRGHDITVRVTDFTLIGVASEQLDAIPNPDCNQYGAPGPDEPIIPTAVRDIYLCGDDLDWVCLDADDNVVSAPIPGQSVLLRAAVHYSNSHPTQTDPTVEVNVRFEISRLPDGAVLQELTDTVRFGGPATGLAVVTWEVPADLDRNYLVTVRLDADMEQAVINDQATRGLRVGMPDPVGTIAVRDLAGACGDPQWVSGRAVYANDLSRPVICGAVTVHAYAINVHDPDDSLTLLGMAPGGRTDSSGYFNLNLNGLLQAGANLVRVVVTDAGERGLRGEADLPIHCGGSTGGGGGGGTGGSVVGGDLFVFAEHIGFLDYEAFECVSLNRLPLAGEEICIHALPQYVDGGAGEVNVAVEINVLVPLVTGNGALTAFNILPGADGLPSTFAFPGSGGAAPVTLSPWVPLHDGPQIIQVVINPDRSPLPFADPTGNNAATRLLFVGPQDVVLSALPARMTVNQGDGATFTIEGATLGQNTPTLNLQSMIDATSPPAGLRSELQQNSLALPGSTTLTVATTTATPPGTYQVYVSGAGDGQAAMTLVQVTVLDVTAPIINCPGGITVQCDSDVLAADVATVSASDDFSPSPLVTHEGDQISGASPKIIQRTYKATDAAGNSATCTQTITVHDTTPPGIQCPSASAIVANSSCLAELPDLRGRALVSDGCTLPADILVSQQPAPGAMIGLGDHIVILTATDAAGNEQTCTTAVTVRDESGPLIVCAGPVRLVADANCQAAAPNLVVSAQAVDCAGSVSVSQSPAANTLLGPGQHAITLTAMDAAGNTASCPVEVTVVDETGPALACPAAVQLEADGTGQSTLPDLTAGLAASDCSGVIGPVQSPAAGTRLAAGTHLVLITTTDSLGNASTCTVAVTVTGHGNTPPVVTIEQPVSAAIAPVGQAIVFAGSFADDGPAGTHTAQWVVSSTMLPATAFAGTVSGFAVAGSFEFPGPGVYAIKLVVTDAQGAAGEANTVLNDLPAYVVIYDPNGGFVTGGGWIWSPPGAVRPGLEEFVPVEGRANFGFVSKYNKGASVPTGQTQFQFKAGDLNFHSATYQWLVVAGDRAQFKGTGTINGVGDFGFLLTAIDGQTKGSDGQDRFRISITDRATGEVVYDNMPDSSNDPDSGSLQAIGGGSIVIHKPR